MNGKKMQRRLAIICNLFIGIMSFGSWIFMAVLTVEGASLASNGLGSLKFFTVLSNLLNGLISLLYAYWLLGNKDMDSVKRTLKMMGTAAVTLTFLTVMLMLGPLYGYRNMFNGSNLWMHLILPLLSIISFITLENNDTATAKSALWAALPTLVYEIGYLGNIFVNGIGHYPHSNDFYGFLNWGYGIGAVIAVTMLLISCGIAKVLKVLSVLLARSCKQ